MNLYHLRYFYDASIMQSFSQSARKNKISQSAVSLAIKSLESELNCELILHKKNRFQLTEVGKAIFAECANIFLMVDNLKSITTNYNTNYIGDLSIASSSSISEVYFSKVVSILQKNYPMIKIKLFNSNCDDVYEKVLNQQVDFGLIVDIHESPNLNSIILERGDFYIVSSPQLKTPLDESSFILRPQSYAETILCHEFFRKKKVAFPKKIIEIYGWQLIRSLAIDKHGYALLPKYVIEKSLAKKELKIHEEYGKIAPFIIQAISLKSRILPKNAQLLLDLINNIR